MTGEGQRDVPLWRQALDEIKNEVRAGFKRTPPSDGVLSKFMEEFAHDFQRVLDVADGEAVWRRIRGNLRILAHDLGAFAEGQAQADNNGVIQVKQLREALAVVKPRCTALQDPSGEQIRTFYDICLNVPTNPQPGD